METDIGSSRISEAGHLFPAEDAFNQKRHRSTGVREAEPNIWIEVVRIDNDQAHDRAGRVGPIFNHIVVDARNQVPLCSRPAASAAAWNIRVGKHDSFASIEFCKYRSER